MLSTLGGLIGITSNACYSLGQDGRWSQTGSMKKIRRFSAAVSSEAYGLVATGGESNSKTRHSSIEHLRGNIWIELPGTLLKISRHCCLRLG